MPLIEIKDSVNTFIGMHNISHKDFDNKRYLPALLIKSCFQLWPETKKNIILLVKFKRNRIEVLYKKLHVKT